MSDYAKKLKSDLLEQFKNRPRIDALLEVIGKQFDDIAKFYNQIRTETDVETAVGKQLDGIGDIVVLPRADVEKMMSGQEEFANTDDDTYRRYLIYKILKNTCNCTYADIMKAIGMFWKGPPLRYSEDPDKPATICLDFDASKDLADQAMGIPYVKAGGVGLHITMHDKGDAAVYAGVAYQKSITKIIECKEPVFPSNNATTDES